MIRIIVAISKNRAIGKDNKLLWKLSSDLKIFKKLTTGSSVVMGRKTYESVGKPLPKRRNIIISRDENYQIDGCEVVNSIDEALLLTGSDCFIIGGGEIYKQTLPLADKLYITEVDVEIEGDTFFPELSKDLAVIKSQQFKADENNEYDFTFTEYERYKF